MPLSDCPRFPLFVSLEGRRVLLAGGGPVALRRARALLPFGCRVVVAAPGALPELQELARAGQLDLLPRPFEDSDLTGAALCVAATDDRAVNRRIGQLARGLGIPVSVADAAEECTFFFPAVVRAPQGVVGICGSGKNHAGVKALAQQIRKLVEP